MIDNKYKFTGDIDSITLKEGNPLDAYLPDGTKLQVQDMGNYYAYSNGLNIWRIPRSKFEGEQLKKGPAEDIDKVMLGTLAMGLGPIALPELFGPLVTNIVNNPQMWGLALQRTAAGIAGYEGVNELNKQINGETWGEGIHRLSGGRVPVWVGDLTNPGGFLEGVVTNVGNKVLNNVAEKVSKSTAPFLLYREISRSTPQIPIKLETSLYLKPSTETAVSQPYVRWSLKGFLNEAQDVYLTLNPNQKFQIVKDVDNPLVGVFNNNGNGEYSLHFHTKREGFTPELKDAMFSTVADVIPEGGIVSTWGNVSKGGFHGLRRFGNLFKWPQIGIRENGNYISKEDVNPIAWLWGRKDLGIPVFHKPTTTRPFMYDSKGNFVGNPNNYYRTGWGIIDDALDSGVIRVPEGDYKPAVFEKYPFLVDNNPFSTQKLSHKFPYFLRFGPEGYGNGSASTKRLKFGENLPPLPEDLIVIPEEGVEWAGAGKFSDLRADLTPSETGGRGTPLVEGQTNRFPTSGAQLFKFNTETLLYEPITVNGITRTVSEDGKKIKLSLPSHTQSHPRLFILDPQGNNKFYVHMKTWDGDHIPANLTNEEKQALFQALYNELPEGAEILLPLSNDKYLATRGTIAGLQRLARDPRFTPGTPGIVKYLDKDRTVKIYNGTSFIKTRNNKVVKLKLIRGIDGQQDIVPEITEENASRITPEEWNRQFRAAEARGDVEEGLRLRILYSTVKNPDVTIKSPMQIKGSYGIDDLHIITKPEEVIQITRLLSDSSIPHTSNSHFNAGYWIRQDPSKLISLKEIPNLQETIDYIIKNTNLIRLEFLDSNYINGFRNIAQLQGINVSSLSNEDIAKILTELYDQLANTSSGLLKNNVFWRTWGRYKPQDYFDWLNHLGELTKNEGFWGSGNYFASGRMAVNNIPSNNNPYMIKGITEIGYDDLLGATDAAGDAIRSGELAGAKLANAWMNESPNTRLVAATPKGMRNRYGWIDDNQFGIEVVTKKNSEIKSLYPDLHNGNGQTFVRDWSNPNTFLFSTQPIRKFEGTQETSIHPLEARLERLREKVREGVIPETKLLGLIGKDLTPMDIKSALIELDPTLTDKLLQGAILVAMAKKLGVHIPFGTETTTDAGLSIVDIADAVRLLKKHHITNPTSKDIENIIAHEFGHSTAYEIPEDVRPLLEGYYDPNEFFTLAGLILDNAGIKETVNNPVSYKDFMDMLAQYQSQGNLDNGISLLADFMKLFSATSGNRWKDASTIVKRNQLMKYINRLSAGLYGAYLLRNKNGKTLQ